MDAQPGKPSDTLNVMGGGIVTAGGGGQGILYVRNSNNSLNLYGGTYVVTGTQNIIGDFRGPTTIGDGVTFQKKDDATITNVKGTTLTMLGGKIEGILQIMDNKTSTAAATTAGAIVMKGGTIEGTLAIIKQDDENLVGSATITGGVIGKMTMDAKATVTVAGAPVISMLEIPANAKITLGELLRSAKITVKASGVFTNANDNVAAYKDYFVAATGSIQIDGKTLKCS